MTQFLAGVERRALRMAEIATGQREEALDIVQDAMAKLVERYAGRDPGQWPPLFQRILQNRIRDWHRRHRLRARLWGWLTPTGDTGGDPLDAVPGPAAERPEQRLQQGYALRRIDAALRCLPLRQQQAFLLRVWEGLDVAQTARAMGCSTGSVKTHYSRAVQKLQTQLGDLQP